MAMADNLQRRLEDGADVLANLRMARPAIAGDIQDVNLAILNESDECLDRWIDEVRLLVPNTGIDCSSAPRFVDAAENDGPIGGLDVLVGTSLVPRIVVFDEAIVGEPGRWAVLGSPT